MRPPESTRTQIHRNLHRCKIRRVLLWPRSPPENGHHQRNRDGLSLPEKHLAHMESVAEFLCASRWREGKVSVRQVRHGRLPSLRFGSCSTPLGAVAPSSTEPVPVSALRVTITDASSPPAPPGRPPLGLCPSRRKGPSLRSRSSGFPQPSARRLTKRPRPARMTLSVLLRSCGSRGADHDRREGSAPRLSPTKKEQHHAIPC